ncbi:Transcriptional regulator, TetR family [Alloactinosynnema sp. L-07]|uniref:TetR/AcrR family transcriptional regulator n=1 Tax=Alloactinosynnema sp. L-07 TaxID=1653480 RepID=UPI00065EF29F|nr:TetR/AcrR family transcriptional regulator [Alloactinosynnema sp. L-07]CRK60505.1 Transcriptional regulator, TetR family [Alloactinosynnema sp. L-07]
MATGTRERIIDAALGLFVERGVAATPVTAIEAAAGLSAGSGGFYRHFPDKDALLAAVVERELVRVRKDPDTRQASTGGPITDGLAARLRSDLTFLADLRPLIAILMWERGRAPQVAETVQKMMMDRGVEMGVADLLFGDPTPLVAEDPAAAAAVMQSAMIGYFVAADYFGVPPAGVDARRFTDTLAKLLTRHPGRESA